MAGPALGLGDCSGGDAATIEALSDYRLPPSIHDLFVNDLHRRFFQRLHRVSQDDVEVTGRNCDNYEIYTGSPSYLITAGGTPATYAIDPGPGLLTSKGRRKNAQQLGVAVTTSFMPTGLSAGPGTQNHARDLIQFSHFSDTFDVNSEGFPETMNYGVAPDFACGHGVYLPDWVRVSADPQFSDTPGFHFVNKGSDSHSPGFFWRSTKMEIMP
ncbi:MAG: hypothetical protein WKG06_22295 [Segetibacter sp.]